MNKFADQSAPATLLSVCSPKFTLQQSFAVFGMAVAVAVGVAVALLLCASWCNAAAVAEHSLDSGSSFQQIGMLHLEDGLKGNQPVVTGSYERQPISSSQMQQLQQLVAQDRLYLWRVKLQGQPAVLTSIKAACLAQHYAELSPIITLDSTGRIVSSQLAVPGTQDGACSVSKALLQLNNIPEGELLQPGPLKLVVNTPKQAPGVPKGSADAAAMDLSTVGGAPQPQQGGQQPPQQQPAGQQGAASTGQQGGKEPEQKAPDTRTWWEKNWLFVMAGGTMALNIALKATVGDLPQQGQQRQGAPVARPAGAGARRQ